MRTLIYHVRTGVPQHLQVLHGVKDPFADIWLINLQWPRFSGHSAIKPQILLESALFPYMLLEISSRPANW